MKGQLVKFAKISLVLSLPLLIAAATQPVAADRKPSEKAAQRAAELQKDLKNFSLQLQYHGASDKPYYNLLLSVRPREKEGGASLNSQIKEATAGKIIDHLALEGFLDNAVKDLPKEGVTGYILTVNGVYSENMGFDLTMLSRLDKLLPLLEEKDAQKQLGIVIQRLSGHRKVWQGEP